MAAISLAKPGSKHGPCAVSCAHRDCASTRRMAESVCRFCSKKIGYETRFYGDPDDESKYVHAVCLEDAITKERAEAA
jgi:hypothetical protein